MSTRVPVTAHTPTGLGQPILVLGGFLISPETYQPMADTLQRLAGQTVRVVPVSKLDWLLTVFPLGWARILDRVAAAVRALAAAEDIHRILFRYHPSLQTQCHIQLREVD
jgi:hypothetical protein